MNTNTQRGSQERASSSMLRPLLVLGLVTATLLGATGCATRTVVYEPAYARTVYVAPAYHTTYCSHRWWGGEVCTTR
jgi:hypothetical protein